MYTRFGKLGAKGQTTVKESTTIEAAEASLNKSLAEKLKKGYVEVEPGEPLAHKEPQRTIPNHAETLERAQDADATALQLEQLFLEFKQCAVGESPCPKCENDDVYFDLVEDALDVLASSPNINAELMDSVIETALEWQGKIVSLVPCIAGNSAVTSSGKDVVLGADAYMWQVFSDEPFESFAEDYAKRIGQAVRGNPAFSAEECATYAVAAARELDERGRPITPGELLFDLDEFPKIWDQLRAFFGDADASVLGMRFQLSEPGGSDSALVVMQLSYEDNRLLIRAGQNSDLFKAGEPFIQYQWEELDELGLRGEEVERAYELSLSDPTLGEAYAAVCEAIWPFKESELTLEPFDERSKSRFCTQCGAQRSDSARFCGECGTRFNH